MSQMIQQEMLAYMTLCNGIFEDQLLEEVSLEKLANLIVRGGWPENISAPDNLLHLMPRAYMDNIIEEDLKKV